MNLFLLHFKQGNSDGSSACSSDHLQDQLSLKLWHILVASLSVSHQHRSHTSIYNSNIMFIDPLILHNYIHIYSHFFVGCAHIVNPVQARGSVGKIFQDFMVIKENADLLSAVLHLGTLHCPVFF